MDGDFIDWWYFVVNSGFSWENKSRPYTPKVIYFSTPKVI